MYACSSTSIHKCVYVHLKSAFMRRRTHACMRVARRLYISVYTYTSKYAHKGVHEEEDTCVCEEEDTCMSQIHTPRSMHIRAFMRLDVCVCDL